MLGLLGLKFEPHPFFMVLTKKLKDRITHMSTSSNKQQKKGKDGMGNAGKRKEMVKDWRVQQGTRV